MARLKATDIIDVKMAKDGVTFIATQRNKIKKRVFADGEKVKGSRYYTNSVGAKVENIAPVPSYRLTGIFASKAEPIDEWARVQKMREDKHSLCRGGGYKETPFHNNHVLVSSGYGQQKRTVKKVGR